MYNTCISPMFCSIDTDAQHEKYINGGGILKSRQNGSFAYIPHRDHDPKEHDRVMSI